MKSRSGQKKYYWLFWIASSLGYGDSECNFHLMSKKRAEEIGFEKSPGAE